MTERMTVAQARAHGVIGKKRRKLRDFNAELETAWKRLKPDLPAPVREYGGIEGRKHRFDLAWPEFWLAVDVHGGEWVAGRHSRGVGLSRDLEKSRLAQLQGWMFLAYTGGDLKRNIVGVVEEIAKALDSRAL